MNNCLQFPNLSVVYLFVPKVACTSLRAAFVQLESGVSLTAREVTHHQYRRIDRRQVRRLRDQGWAIVGFVRNPWDRLVSCYRNKILSTPEAERLVADYSDEYVNGVFRGFLPFKVFHRGMSFDEFVEAVCGIPDAQANGHFQSQAPWLKDEEGMLPSFIGKFETLQEDFSRLCESLGRPSQLPHLRPSGRHRYEDYYTGRTQGMVAQRYAEDIEVFEYRFGGAL